MTIILRIGQPIRALPSEIETCIQQISTLHRELKEKDYDQKMLENERDLTLASQLQQGWANVINLSFQTYCFITSLKDIPIINDNYPQILLKQEQNYVRRGNKEFMMKGPMLGFRSVSGAGTFGNGDSADGGSITETSYTMYLEEVRRIDEHEPECCYLNVLAYVFRGGVKLATVFMSSSNHVSFLRFLLDSPYFIERHFTRIGRGFPLFWVDPEKLGLPMPIRSLSPRRRLIRMISLLI
ncbi:MAG: hypothetical protein P4L49_16960 [Desulfosporosinus sp.]|nr:hypothetical protein [Desulfosporosinus sp.]